MFEMKNVAFQDIIKIEHLTIQQKKITTLFGCSGSGKTTLLRMLNKMISPTQGEIYYKGQNMKDLSSILHRREVTMLNQTPTIFPGTVEQNINMGLNFQEKPLASMDKIKELLESIHVRKKPDDDASLLSGGEKQRLALARILLLDSPVYLLDEPASALDERTEIMIIEMLLDHVRKKNKSVVMVTHSKAIAKKYSDVIITLEDGSCESEAFDE